MHPLGFDGSLYGAFPPRDLEFLQRRKVLEDEIHAIEERRRRALRRDRRKIIVKQVLQLEAIVRQAQDGRAARSESTSQRPPQVPNVPAREQPPTELEGMLVKLMQQNEELHAIIRTQGNETRQLPRDGALTTETEATSSKKANDEIEINENQLGTRTKPTATKVFLEEPTRTAHPPAPTPVRAWSAVDTQPEVDWTDKDEELLEQLVRGETAENSGMPSMPVDDSIHFSSDGDVSDVAAILKRKQQQDRQESRRKLVHLFDTSAMANTAGILRPRWRIEQDSANGVVRPFDDGDQGAMSEQPMPTRQVFRSAVIAVMATIELQGLLLEKKLRLRDKSVQDFEPLLNLYADATRLWLGKLVKIPLLSIVQDPALDIDVSAKSGLFHSSKGLSKWFGRSRSPPLGSASTSSTTEHHKIVKLKVRVKGIIDAIVKAIDKGDVPTGIVEFWKRLTSDGVYFPPTYPLCETEREALDLDTLGATRNMQDDTIAHPGPTYPRAQIVLTNFILLRILIPRVVLRPWEIGIGPGTVPKATGTNLKNVATLLYVIVARLSPLPTIEAEPKPGVRHGLRRRSVEVAPIPEHLDVQQISSDNQDANDANGKRFLTIAEIHTLLIPEKQFPLDHVELFINEQKQRLQVALQSLYARVHPRVIETRENSN